MKPMLPKDIEAESFAIITRELGDRSIPEDHAPIVKRVIHTTADFDYAHNLHFTPDVVPLALNLLRDGAVIICDTNMVKAGVSKPALAKLGCDIHCFIADEDVAQAALRDGTTRAVAAVDKAARLAEPRPLIFAVGNAPTALLHLLELREQGLLSPAMVIGAPVGFVNVVESKEQLLASGCPSITARGRKGGSNVAAAVCNALLYQTLR